jgi:hypothetical protein
MTAIVETSTYTATITQLETTDLVLGGVGGPSNRALVEIANRTKWLYDRVQSLTEQPVSALPYPTIATSTNKLTVTPSAATAGGKVAIAAGTRLTLAEEVASAATGRLRTFTTATYLSDDLLVSSTYYLRAQVDSNGALAIYVQRGTDADAIPAGLRGTPGASSGGGFDSTVLDMLIAKVSTGAAGSTPTVTTLANAAKLQSFTYRPNEALSPAPYGTPGSLTAITLNWARRPSVSVNMEGYANTGMNGDYWTTPAAGESAAIVRMRVFSTATRYSIALSYFYSDVTVTSGAWSGTITALC